MLIYCEGCNIKVPSCEIWIDHLVSAQHQSQYVTPPNTVFSAYDRPENGNESVQNFEPEIIQQLFAFLRWDREADERSLLITGFADYHTPSTIARYYSKYGLLSDFYFQPNRNFCIVQFDSRYPADYALGHSHLQSDFTCCPKTVVSSLEWLLLTCLDNVEDMKFMIHHMNMYNTLRSIDFNNQLGKFMEMSAISSAGQYNRTAILYELQALVKPEFYCCMVYTFGHSITGFEGDDTVLRFHLDALGTTLPGSQIQPTYAQTIMNGAALKILQSIRSSLIPTSRRRFAQNAVFLIPDSPLRGIKFVHEETAIVCEVYFDAIFEVYLSQFISFLTNVDPRVRPLCRLLIYWGRFHKVTICEQMNNGLVLLMVVFLIQRNIIPSLAVLQSLIFGPKNPFFVDGWDVSYSVELIKIKNYLASLPSRCPIRNDLGSDETSTKNIFSLAVSFFELMSVLDFQKYMVCSRSGEVILKSIFLPEQQHLMPSTLDQYKYHSQNGLHPPCLLNVGNPICVQHPFNLGWNVTIGVDSSLLTKFQQLCGETACKMRELLNTNSMFSNLMSVFPRLQLNPIIVKALMAKPIKQESAALMNYNEVDPTSTSTKSANVVDIQNSAPSTIEGNEKYQNVAKIVAPKSFKDKFMFSTQYIEEDNRLLLRQKYLSLIFFQDFLRVVWNKCFNLIAVSSTITEADERFQVIEEMFNAAHPTEHICTSAESLRKRKIQDKLHTTFKEYNLKHSNEIDWSSDEDSSSWEDIEDLRGKDNSNCSPLRLNTVHSVLSSATLEERVRGITQDLCENFCQIVHCSGHKKTWMNRHKMRESMKMSNYFTKDPLEQEAALTRAILKDANEREKMPILEFICVARIDVESEQPTLYILLKEDKNQDLSKTMINYMIPCFKNLVRKYLLDRLDNFLTMSSINIK